MRASESTQAFAFVLLIIFLAYVILILVPFLRRKIDPEGDPSLFTWHVLVPCRDEAAVIGATLHRLRQDFPMAHVWVIDDDSDDDTADIVRSWVERDPLVHLIERKRPEARTGKGAALNVGYNTLSNWLPADADRDHTIVAVVDADGVLAPNAFRQAAGPQAFGDPATGAAQAAVWMSNRNDKTPLPEGTSKAGQAWGRYLVRMQDIEFRTTIAAMQSLRRHTFSVGLGGNGQFSRLAALDRIKQVAGDPWHGSLLEDYELGIHVMLVGYRTSYMHDTHVEQEALPSTRRLLTQRVRWCQGGMQCTRYLPAIFQSPHFTNAGALEATYFLLVPFIQLLGLVLWPAAFIAMAAAGTIYAGGFIAFLVGAWWLIPLVVLTGIVPFAIWAPIYRKQAQPDASIGQTVLWGLGYWLYIYQNYICVIRAFFRLITGKDGWAKTRRNAEEGTKLLARDT